MKPFLTANMSTLLLYFFILGSLTTFVPAQELDDETGFNYIPGSDKGPENWGFLHENWRICNTGTRQSPLNLPLGTPRPAPIAQQIFTFYQPAQAILKNRGHDIALEWQGGTSKIQINGVDYFLKNCHWHSPSEHVFLGVRYALEIHLVHQSLAGKIAVIGVLYRYGRPDPFLSQLEQKLRVLASNTNQREVNAGIVDPKAIKTVDFNSYVRYNGSLTTPPCTEGVLWTVIERIASVSTEQVALLRQAVDDGFENNARPLQWLNGRRLELYCQPSLNAIPLAQSSQHLSSM